MKRHDYNKYACEDEELKRLYKNYNYRLTQIERKIDYCIKNYEENKNADLMIIARLENIADFLKNNYNVVIEEKEKYNYPY